MTLEEAVAQRRSVRAFTDAAVTAEQIQDLLAAAVQAPTAMHDEPWRFVVVQNRARLRRYSDAAKALLLGERHVYRDLHDPHLSSRHHVFFDALKQPDFNVFYDASTLIVIAASGSGPFVDADCWLAAENLMLTARAIGLGTCCIGSAVPALNSVDIKSELGIAFDIDVVAAIVVGVPVSWPPASGRQAPVILSWLTSDHHPPATKSADTGSRWPE